MNDPSNEKPTLKITEIVDLGAAKSYRGANQLVPVYLIITQFVNQSATLGMVDQEQVVRFLFCEMNNENKKQLHHWDMSLFEFAKISRFFSPRHFRSEPQNEQISLSQSGRSLGMNFLST